MYHELIERLVLILAQTEGWEIEDIHGDNPRMKVYLKMAAACLGEIDNYLEEQEVEFGDLEVNENFTTVFEVLQNVLKERGLRLQEELPPFPGYEKEWAIEDNEGWSYGSLGLPLSGSYKCRMVDPKSLPFDAKETIDWVQSEIIRQLAQGQESVT